MMRTVDGMKFGIVTITNGPDNYGNILQNYALQRFISELGGDSETILNHSYIEFRKYRLYLLLKFFQSKPKTVKRIKFLKFCKRYISYGKTTVSSNKPISREFESKYDFVLVGSDQIWNPEFSFNHNWQFGFAQFVSREKRIAFSPSFGLNNISEPYYSRFSEYLNGFKALSARENWGSKIISDMTNRECLVLCDPCLLVSKANWHEICKPIQKLNHKKYAVKYVLGIEDKRVYKALGDIEVEEVVDIMDVKSPFYALGPDEFIWLIENAEMIITDSFHASLFSIVFKKRFTVFRRIGEGDTFDRINTLLNSFGINNDSDVIKVDESQLKDSEVVIQNMAKGAEEYINRAIMI